MVSIVQKESAVLREIAVDVPQKEIKTPKIRKIIESMKRALDEQEDGVAIAAPQIGESMRIFVVSKRIFDMEINEETNRPRKIESASNGEKSDMVFINPKLKKLSRQKRFMEEGCLSVRWLYGFVNRSVKAAIEAYDEEGRKISRGASGLLAQVFQHEVDHLNGVLFIDKARNVREMPPEDIDVK